MGVRIFIIFKNSYMLAEANQRVCFTIVEPLMPYQLNTINRTLLFHPTLQKPEING